MTVLRGWRYAVFIGSIVGFTLLATYPIIIQPMISTEHYKHIRSHIEPKLKSKTGVDN